MNVILEKIILHNFMSFEDAVIELADNGYCIVSGNNEFVQDCSLSNGSGKSSIWESIVWSLTGETIRGCKDVVRHECSDGCFVQIYFSVNGIEYIILRSKNHIKYKTSLFLNVNGKDISGKGIRESQKILSEYLPDITSDLLGSVIVLGQGLPKRFTSNTPSGRKEILEKLSSSDYMVEDIKNRVQKRIDFYTDKSQLLKIENAQLNTQMSMTQCDINRCQSELNGLPNIDDLNTNLVESKNTENIILQSIDGTKNTLTQLSFEIDSLTSQITTISSSIDCEYEPIISQLEEKISEYNRMYNINLMEFNAINTEIKKRESVVDVCPTCGQKLQNIVKLDTTELYSQLKSIDLNNISATIDMYKANLNSTKNDVRNLKEIRVCEIRQCLNSTKAQISTTQKTLESQLKSLADTQTTIATIEMCLKNRETTETDLKLKIESDNQLLINIQNKLNMNIATLKNFDERLSILSKFLTATKRDFRGYLLKNIVNYIDTRAKSYCQDMFNHICLDFLLDKNDIKIMYLGKEYESLSGGERQKIDIIIQFSIRDMLVQYLNFTCNCLILDELTDSLDTLGCQKLISLISKRLSDVDSIYIVSHRIDLDIPADSEIIVYKDINGVSSVVQR